MSQVSPNDEPLDSCVYAFRDKREILGMIRASRTVRKVEMHAHMSYIPKGLFCTGVQNSYDDNTHIHTHLCQALRGKMTTPPSVFLLSFTQQCVLTFIYATKRSCCMETIQRLYYSCDMI